MRLVILGALACLLAVPALAQRAVVGTVTDVETGEPLPGANVAVLDADGAVIGGTATNADGRFSLRLAALPADLAVRFLGFETARITVTASTPMPLAVRLAPSAQELGSVTVRPGEDPAVALMRRVIARVRGQRDALGPYAVTAYSRSTIFMPTGEVQGIREGVSDAYWAPGDGWREAVVATRQTGNLSADGGTGPVAEQLLDLLAADIEVQGHRLMGPTHPNALDAYTFELGPTSGLDGRLVVEVSLRPKRATASAFIGTMQVLVETADVLSADLRPGAAFVFPPPIEVTEGRFRQQYVPVAADSSLWLPADLESGYAFSINVVGLITSDPFRIERASQFSAYRLGVVAPDSLRMGERLQRAVVMDSLRLDAAGVAPPLTDIEARAYAAGDSLGPLSDVLVLRGPLGGLARGNISVSDGGSPEPEKPRPFFAATPSPGLTFNPVEGVRAMLGADLRLASLRVSPRVGIGPTGGTLLAADASHPLVRIGKARLSVVGSVHEGVERRIAPSAPGLAAGLATGRGGYYRSERASAGLRVSASDLGSWNGGSGVMTQLSTDAYAELRFVAERADSLFSGRTDSDLLAFDTYALRRGLRFDAGVGTLGIPLGLLPRRALRVTAEVVPSAFGAGPEFWRADLTVDHRIVTFARRRALPMALDLRLAGGVSGGDVPMFRRFANERALGADVAGSFGVAHTTFGALRARTDVPDAGERYALAAWEHSFRTIPFEALGLTALSSRNVMLLVHGAHARTWGSLEAADAWHHEVGVSLSGILGAFRLDLTQRLDAPGTVLGVGVARAF